VNPGKKLYQRRKCARSPIPEQEELPTSVVEEKQGGERTSEVDKTSAGDATAATVQEGVHATHGEVRYECEVFIGPILLLVSS